MTTPTSFSRPRLTSAFRFSQLLVLVLLITPAILAQTGRVVRDTVHSRSLEKTVTGESPDRSVIIYLPPSYDTSPTKRYPVIYLLHGITDTNGVWVRPWTKRTDKWGTLPEVMDSGVAERAFGEMIVVMPDELTKWGGSFYSNSTVTGNWEDFTAKELVSYIDGKYRTFARASSRGLVGHSMGGYGAIKLGMKHPDVFSVIYGLNPAVLGWGRDLTLDNPGFTAVLNAKTPEDAMKSGFYALGVIVIAQAFSPNPDRPPFFVDFPFALVDGKLQPAEPGFSKWQKNLPVNMVEEYSGNLEKLRGLRFDSGYEDEFTHIPPTSRAFSLALTARGIDHVFEEYNGDHRNRLWGRNGRVATEVLPYFWRLLDSQEQR
ncbi:MAG TPA: alpha/beta hydrolase-fold protein [Pyrinomonadaceae bacterium]|nr:alpha/beta hydrolase-fold protein [Pyrinomonadaceae bacterium]